MSTPPPQALSFPFATAPRGGDAITVAPGLHWIRTPLPFALDHINLWLIDDDEATTIVDCGYGDAATRALWERQFETVLAGRRVRRIVATHCHPDHVGNAAWLAQRFAAPVAMTHAEFMTAHALAHGHAGFGPERIMALFACHGLAGAQFEALAARGNHYRRGVPELPESFERLLDGEEIDAGGVRWRVLEGHGHSPEHASLHSPALRVLIAGDMLLPRISTNVSIWAVEPDADPLGRFLASLAAFEALPDDTLVLPSHGLPFRGISTRVAELRAHHAARLDELLAAARAAGHPVTAADLVPVLFRRELDLQQLFFAMGEAIAHLNHLWRAGRLVRDRDPDGILHFAAMG